jgi:aspartate aminotransferase
MDLAPLLSAGGDAEAGLSALARGVIGSEILRIASEIRALKARGTSICNLTVGDFDPALFPIPAELLEGTRAALAAGQTNYPPSDGVLELREAVARFYARELGLSYPVESVLIAGGARPLLYGAYLTLLDRGDVAIYPVPSWNNNHYAYLVGARAVELAVSAATNFFPTADQIRPHVGEAHLLTLNSPLNPTGTVIDREELRRISELVVEENDRRRRAGTRPLWFVFDQVYWTLTFGGVKHATPIELVPEVAPYTLLLDAISKSFCATGMRVGWGLMAPGVRKRMADILGHVGAWAPKAEQVAVAAWLDSPGPRESFQATMRSHVKERLDSLYSGFTELAREGLPIEVIAPQGAIYLSARFDLFGRTVAETTFRTNDDIRRFLLEKAGLAVVPFQAFGLKGDTGWFRLSVGAVSMQDIAAVLPRLGTLLGGLRGAKS